MSVVMKKSHLLHGKNTMIDLNKILKCKETIQTTTQCYDFISYIVVKIESESLNIK